MKSDEQMYESTVITLNYHGKNFPGFKQYHIQPVTMTVSLLEAGIIGTKELDFRRHK